MTIRELYFRLEESRIPKERYYLNGVYGSSSDEDKLSLLIKKGKYSIEYEVYYKERGEKHSLIIFVSEDEACQYVYRKLKENKEIEDKFSKHPEIQ